MCQLSLIDTSNKLTNILFGFILSKNSMKNNPHGWGIYSPKNKLYKNSVMPHVDEEFYTMIPKLKADTLIGHVRLASIKNKAIITKDSHPFEKTNIVLAHNGTLFRKIGDTPLDIIDSEDFANLLDEEYGRTGDMFNSIKYVYNKYFYGKFAFIIYSKLEDKYFVARGWTADLHWSKIKIEYPGGKESEHLIINTDKESLVEACQDFATLFALKGDIHSISWDIKMLTANSVYEIMDHDVVHLGNVYQTDSKPIPKSEVTVLTPSNTTTSNNVTNIKQPVNTNSASYRYYLLGKLLSKAGLSEREVYAYLMAVSGNRKELLVTGDEVSKASSLIETHYCTIKGELWNEIALNYFGDELSPYLKHNLLFPYYLNTIPRLREVVEAEKK